MRSRSSLLAVAAIVVATSVSGCESGCSGPVYIYSCPESERIYGRKDSTGYPDPCCKREPCPPDAGTDAPTGDGSCSAGQCIPGVPDGWSREPVLLWQGTPGQEPSCPKDAPVDGYKGRDPIAPPLSCPLCQCSAPTGTCERPEKITAHTALCNLPGTDIAFDAPSSWDGTCTTEKAIPPCMMGIDCVQSMTVDPLIMKDDVCEPAPVTIPITDAPPSWGLSALTCSTHVDATDCQMGKQICAPFALPPPAGFEVCVWNQGEGHTCPDAYPHEYVFYQGVDDERYCTDCSCEPPVGSLCTATLSVYQDDACSVPIPFTAEVSSMMAACSELPITGVALGSKEMTNPIYQPGACLPAGGEPTGQLVPILPITYCCLPAPP